MTEMYSDHFSVKELQCPTSFKIKLAYGFIGDLEELRVAYAHGMEVTDGCRDESYNEWLISRGYPASENSFHLIKNVKYMTEGCCAVDVARPDAVLLHSLIKHATALNWSIGLGKTFVHLDRRARYTDMEALFYAYR
jgi:hypothetical protein